MSNINQLVQEDLLNEGRQLGSTVAGITGAGGVYTGGGVAGHYHSRKLEQADKEIAKLKGKPMGDYDAERSGRHIGKAVAGSIPIVGAASNLGVAKQHYDAVDKLRKLQKKKK